MKLIKHPAGRWTTRGIISQEFNFETKTMKFKTNKLGNL